MAERRLRTRQLKKRRRAKFWDQNGEKLRLVLVGVVVVGLASLIAKLVFGA